MINHIIKYQNNFSSHTMFLKNFSTLVEKGIDIGPLLESNVFRYKINFEEWPNSHSCNEVCTKAYTDNFFNLRESYREVFHEDEFEIDDPKKMKGKVCTIEYNLNLMPLIDRHVMTETGQVNNPET